jgi:ribonucleoside-diphosphate reductase alpha chain
MPYSFDVAYEESLRYFGGDEIAAKVFLAKYALRNADGDLLEKTPKKMHRRLAKEFARIESKYPNSLSEKEILNYFDKFKYIVPQGSPMAGIGDTNRMLSLSNCFVIQSPHDSYGGIMKADQEQAQIMKRRGGVGFDVSTIRPKGMHTSNAAKTTDGIPIFLERFSNTCREVAQGGRRGALMLTLSVHHPDIREFINIKRDLTKVTGANISIRITDEFMEAVEASGQFELRYPVDADEPEVTQMIDAKELWQEITEAAHASAEPGLLFWDNIINNSPADAYTDVGFGTTSTNPCGELVLSPYDSCRLLLVNAVSFVSDSFTDQASFDWDKFSQVSYDAQKLMDDLIDLELESLDKILLKIDKDPEPDEVKHVERCLWQKIRAACVDGRRTGLGMTAVGDTVACLNLTYGSEKSVEFIEKLYQTMCLSSYRASVDMARDRGTFPCYDFNKEKNHPFITRVMALDDELRVDWEKYGRRNIANTTTAPAGSVSIMTQTTSGIEPVFRVSYTRRRKINPDDESSRVDFVDDLGDKWQEYEVRHRLFAEWQTTSGKTLVEDSPYHKATAQDISWVDKVKAQSAAQRWIGHSISNTTNIPEETTVDVVQDIYLTGWKSGCKGVTIYRDNSRAGVLVASPTPAATTKGSEFEDRHAPKRPDELDCDIYHIQVRGEKWNVFVGLLQGRPYELFAGRAHFVKIPRRYKKGVIVKGKNYVLKYGETDSETEVADLAAVFANSTESAFTRTISLALRHGTPAHYVVEQLQKGAAKDSEMFSLSKGLMRVLKTYIEDGVRPSQKACESCGDTTNLVYQDGCVSCLSCGFSKCG